jgi:predicted RNase H-like HicB family nuclease
VPVNPVWRLPLRIVFYQQDGDWVAHCLEFDLMGDGETKEDALEQLAEAIVLQIEATAKLRNPANLISPADGKFFAMFAAGKDIVRAELQLKLPAPRIDNFEIEDCEYREYVGGEPCAV